MKTPKTTSAKSAPETKAELSAATTVKEATPKKPSPAKKAPKKAQAAAPKKPAAAAPEMAMPERVGLAAGSIWNYLADNGTTPVAKLVKALPEEEKILQRSIGWLAQEGKIVLDSSNRVETISLQ